MKLSAITDEISQDFEHALDVLAEYGAQGAELRGLWGTNIGDLTDDQVKRARKALHAHSMRVSCLASPFFKCDMRTSEPTVAGRMHLASARGYDQQMDLLRRLCDLADQFETTFIRVFSFWRRGDPTEEVEAHIVEAFAEPLEIAASRGMTLLLENEHACYLGTGAEIARVIRKVGHPHLRACWDPGNALAAHEVPYPDGYESVRSMVAHVHIKDAVLLDGEPRWCIVGEGVVDYSGQFRALRSDGYDGYISLETHCVPQDGTPEDGSRPCLQALNRLLKDTP
jgi:sugar phosphate isomerase/epimerase